MSDRDDDKNEADRRADNTEADRRADKLGRAIEAARAKRRQGDTPPPAPPSSGPRKMRLPPPPPVDPEDLKALGLAMPRGYPAPREPDPEVEPLVLGTGPTRVVTPEELTFEHPAPPPVAEPVPQPRPLFHPAPAQPVAPQAQPQPTQKPIPPTLLRLEGVFTDIGRYSILQGVDLPVPEGEVTMLLGRNGVGKTTTLRTIMGLWRARQGKIWLDGRNLAPLAPAAIARAGVGYVPEDMGIFGDLTVEENMRLGARSGRMERRRVDWLLTAFPALKTFWHKPAANLSGGQKQMLSIARILVEPRRLYLIDEPTKGLAPAIVSTLAGALRDLKKEGATILMVEQNFSVAKALGDSCAVMDDGRVIWHGSMKTLANDAGLQAELMGLHLEAGH